MASGSLAAIRLSQVVQGYEPMEHPVLGPLIAGGPTALAERTGVGTESHFVSECHACYEIRRVLRLEPEYRPLLGPNQVYGEEPEPPPTSYL